MRDSLQVGQVESVKRLLSQQDFDRFAALSGDDNPIHVDPAFAARTKFRWTVAHGMFLYSIVCSVLGTRLPGPGTMQLEQELMFPSPTYVGEEVTIQLKVTKAAEALADLSTVVARPEGSLGLQGRTLVRLPGVVEFGCFEKPPKSEHKAAGDVSFKGLEIGQRAQTCRAFTVQDLAEYTDLTGDTNPIFTDASCAQQLGLPGPMIPGGLLGGLFSCLLGTELPGRGTDYLKQRLEFPTPAYQNEQLTATIEVVRIRAEKELVNLSTVCTNPAGQVVCQGEALVLVSDV